MQPHAGPLVEDGWSALSRGAWAEAVTCLQAAVARSDDARAYEGLAWAAWWCNDEPLVFSAREHAFKRYRQLDDPVSAARVAIWLGCDHHDFRGEHAVANGWYQRARRLLIGVPTCAEHGWLAFQEGAYALELDDDTVTARARAADVATIAASLQHVDLEFLGLALDGLALVTEGRVTEGMHRLDEVGVAATTGEINDRIATSWSLCYLIYACERARDFDRVSQWCERMRELSTRNVFEFGLGVCRAHYGGVLVLRGRWDSAEDELVAAGHSLARSRPAAMGEYASRLGELRRRQGRVDEATELFEAAAGHPLATVGLAHVALDRGDAVRAVELLDDLLAATSPSSASQRSDALELLARGRAASGDHDGAVAAAAALRSIAASVRTSPLRAMAAVAEAAVATSAGDDGQARRLLEEAISHFERCGLPYEAECARIDLAMVLGRMRRHESADELARRAEARLRDLGAVADAERAARAVPAGRSRADSPLAALSARETEVIALLVEGLTDRELAGRLHISAHTAHRHVSNILTKLGVSGRTAAAAIAARHGLGEPRSYPTPREPSERVSS